MNNFTNTRFPLRPAIFSYKRFTFTQHRCYIRPTKSTCYSDTATSSHDISSDKVTHLPIKEWKDTAERMHFDTNFKLCEKWEDFNSGSFFAPGYNHSQSKPPCDKHSAPTANILNIDVHNTRSFSHKKQHQHQPALKKPNPKELLRSALAEYGRVSVWDVYGGGRCPCGEKMYSPENECPSCRIALEKVNEEYKKSRNIGAAISLYRR
jgi:hypothetical protein